MSDRRQHWQQVYRERSPLSVSWYQPEPALSLQLIHRTGVGHDAAIIDVGGGASLLVDYLRQEGFSDLSVLDISGIALASARERLGEAAPGITWFEADITAFDPPRDYALWHDRAVFHFLTDESDRAKYVRVLRRALHRGGHVIMAAFAIGGPEQCSGLDVVQYDAGKLLAALGAGFQLLEERSENHRTPSGHEQRFVYFRLIKQP